MSHDMCPRCYICNTESYCLYSVCSHCVDKLTDPAKLSNVEEITQAVRKLVWALEDAGIDLGLDRND